jgi:hypothetical protein
MAEVEKKIQEGGDYGAQESYNNPGHDGSDTEKGSDEAVDSKDMYRMGKDQQFRVSTWRPAIVVEDGSSR